MMEQILISKVDWKVGEKEVSVKGCLNMVLTTVQYKGKSYEKLTFVKRRKTKTAEEDLEKTMDDVIANLDSWMTPGGDGQQLYGHGVTANRTMDNGMRPASYFEWMLERA